MIIKFGRRGILEVDAVFSQTGNHLKIMLVVMGGGGEALFSNSLHWQFTIVVIIRVVMYLVLTPIYCDVHAD